MSAVRVSLLAVYGIGCVVAATVIAVRLSRSEQWGSHNLTVFEMFVGVVLSWVWPLVLVFGAWAWLARKVLRLEAHDDA